jgi:hypothetical protein
MIPASIESFKATIARRSGFAHQNYFSVFMSLPLISIDSSRILVNAASGNTNPSQVLNSPRDVGFLCESCSLPGRVIATQDYQTVKQSVKMPTVFLNDEVTFTFLLTQDYYMKEVFDQWQSQIMDFDRYKLRYKADYTSDIIIDQLNKEGLPVYSVMLQKAFPVAVSSVELSNTGENTIQKVSVTMAYDNFVKQTIGQSTLNKVAAVTEQIKSSATAFERALTNRN